MGRKRKMVKKREKKNKHTALFIKKDISRPMRVAPELVQTINYIRAKYMLEGRQPPSITEITRRIARKIKKEDLLKDEFIRF